MNTLSVGKSTSRSDHAECGAEPGTEIVVAVERDAVCPCLCLCLCEDLRMNVRAQRICLWVTPIAFAVMFIGFFAGSGFPFPSPDHDAAYVGRFYVEHANGIRLMSVFVAAGAAFIAPFAGVLGVHLKRIPGAEALAYVEIGMGCASSLAVGISAFFWQTAAFRPDRDPVVTQSWHDAGWLCFVATVFIVIVQTVMTGLAILTDDGEKPVFPRWLGYVSFWMALLFVPSVLCLWFKTGPFAWNGLLTIYLALVAVAVWFGSVVVVLLRMTAAERTAVG